MHNRTEPPKYRLKVTAGPEYDRATHQQVAVNDKTLHFESDRAAIDLGVHIQNFAGTILKPEFQTNLKRRNYLLD